MQPDSSYLNKLATLLLLAVLGYWFFKLVMPSPGMPPWILLDNLNLLIHEAGHWIFGVFGMTIGIFGGSLNQCLIPAIFGGYFMYKRDWLGSAFSLFWLGDNLINVSYYIGDARAMVLPLLGGDGTIHDWNWLLTHFNILQYDSAIAIIVRLIGDICLVSSLTVVAMIALQAHFKRPPMRSNAPSQAAAS